MTSLSTTEAAAIYAATANTSQIIGYETVYDHSYFAVSETVLPIFLNAAEGNDNQKTIIGVINGIHEGSLAAQSANKMQQINLLQPESLADEQAPVAIEDIPIGKSKERQRSDENLFLPL